MHWEHGIKTSLPAVTPSVKTSSQPTLSSADHLLVGYIVPSIQSINSQSGTCLHPSWEQLLFLFCQDWKYQVSLRRMWSPLSHSMLPGAAWQQGEWLGTVSWFGQAKAVFMPLPIYPKACKKTVQVSCAADGLQEPRIHCPEQEGSDKYSGGFSAFLTRTTSPQACLSLTLYYFTSSSPTFPRPTGISLSRSCQTRTVSLWWWQTSGRALREEAAKFSLLRFERDLAFSLP